MSGILRCYAPPSTFPGCAASTGPTQGRWGPPLGWQGRWGAKKQRPWLGRGLLQNFGGAKFSDHINKYRAHKYNIHQYNKRFVNQW